MNAGRAKFVHLRRINESLFYDPPTVARSRPNVIRDGLGPLLY